MLQFYYTYSLDNKDRCLCCSRRCCIVSHLGGVISSLIKAYNNLQYGFDFEAPTRLQIFIEDAEDFQSNSQLLDELYNITPQQIVEYFSDNYDELSKYLLEYYPIRYMIRGNNIDYSQNLYKPEDFDNWLDKFKSDMEEIGDDEPGEHLDIVIESLSPLFYHSNPEFYFIYNCYADNRTKLKAIMNDIKSKEGLIIDFLESGGME